MTVSPTWPQDGNRQPKGVGNGVESDDSFRSTALPPTLFKLPNLNPAPQKARDSADRPATSTPTSIARGSTPPMPTTRVASTSPIAELEEMEDAVPENLDHLRPETPEVESRQNPKTVTWLPVKAAPPQTPTPNASERPIASPRAPIQSDQPAGRSWMEQIGSHGVVVVLLLVVVSLALATGRNSGSQQGNTLSAEPSEALEFSDAGNRELPLPKHGLNEATHFASSDDVNAPPRQGDATQSPPTPEVSVSGMFAAAGQDSSGAYGPSADSGASLAAPQATPTASRTFNAQSQLDVLPASSRYPAQRGESTLPTLEDLADDSSSTSEPAVVQQPAPTRYLSQTPTPIQNWLQYLPAHEPAQVVGSENFSTSK